MGWGRTERPEGLPEVNRKTIATPRSGSNPLWNSRSASGGTW